MAKSLKLSVSAQLRLPRKTHTTEKPSLLSNLLILLKSYTEEDFNKINDLGKTSKSDSLHKLNEIKAHPPSFGECHYPETGGLKIELPNLTGEKGARFKCRPTLKLKAGLFWFLNLRSQPFTQVGGQPLNLRNCYFGDAGVYP